MSFVFVFLGYVAPVFGLLAAIQLHRSLRSAQSMTLLVSAVVVIVSAAIQVAGMLLGPLMAPEPGSAGMKLLGYIGGHTWWPWTIGEFVYFLTIFLIVRTLPLGGGKSKSGKSIDGASHA